MMNCRSAKTEIALWVGNDLDESDQQKVQEHVNACPECHQYWRQLRASLKTLQETESAATDCLDESLWPRLEQRIAALERSTSPSQFNGWFPAVAVTAACVLILIFSAKAPRPGEEAKNGFEMLVDVEPNIPIHPDWTSRPTMPVRMQPIGLPQSMSIPSGRWPQPGAFAGKLRFPEGDRELSASPQQRVWIRPVHFWYRGN